jgi:regulator of protease activity HflC (stomatin/prohibitin superfamily)
MTDVDGSRAGRSADRSDSHQSITGLGLWGSSPPGPPEHVLVAAVTCDHRLVSAAPVTVVALLVLIIVGLAAVRTVPPQQTYVVELLGRYRRTLEPGIHLLVPFIESVHAKVNMREQVASFPPQPAITSDDLVACIETVLYYRVEDPVRATYETANAVQTMEMLTITTLRDLTGSMDLERTRASRDELNLRLTEVLDRSTSARGIKLIRAEIKAIETGSRLGCP